MMNERPPRLLGEPERVVRVASNFIKHHVTLAQATGVVIGLSGGIDSAVAVSLARQVLSPEQIHAYFLPSPSTPEQDLHDVQELCQQLGLSLTIVPISPLLQAYQSHFEQLRLEVTDYAVSNLHSRIRASLLYTFALSEKKLVLGTGNKTELMLGYFTKYGDGATDINPLGDLYKKHVRQLAELLNVPRSIQGKAPSAGLWPGQTDEDELGFTYADAEAYLWYRERFYTPEEAASLAKVSLELAMKIEKMIEKSEHKRRGSIILKFGYRTPTLDWRVPLG